MRTDKLRSRHGQVALAAMLGLYGPAIQAAAARGKFMTTDEGPWNRNATIDEYGNEAGVRLRGVFADDGITTIDSSGAFLVGQLERLDQTLNMPLADVTYGRDIMMREDVSMADEVASFTLSTFASSGSLGMGNGIRNGKAWVSKETDQIVGVNTDIAKTAQALRLWALELKYTIPEIESAAKLGRPIDEQKYEGLKLKHQMDVDEQVYVGDASTGDTGLFNHGLVTNASNVPNGTGGSPLWANKTPDEILKDVNDLLTDVWTKSGWAVMPKKILLPPTQFGLISTRPITTAGKDSILTYIMENNIVKASGRGQIEFQPVKWAVGTGSGGTIGTADGHDRMVAYTNDKRFVRYPMTMLQRTPVQYKSLWHMTTYFCRLGMVEMVYPETVGYRDGI